MFVEVKVVGQPRVSADREVPTAGSTTMRELLAELVSGELAAYEVHRGEQTVLRVLTPAEIAAAGDTGRVVSGGRAVPAAPTPAVAIQRAVEAFRDQLVYAFLDGQQVDDLDTEIVVGPSSRLRLVRLVALAGG